MAVRYTPEMLMAHFVGLKGLSLKDLDVAPTVVLSWNNRIVRQLANAIGAKPVLGWPDVKRFPFYTGEIAGRRVSFLSAMIGAPAAVMQMEQLIACGARTFFGLGYAGSLQPSSPIGTFFIPTSSLSEEGTSAHYVNAGAEIHPSQSLVEILRKACQAARVGVKAGPLWTTDAPFRELIEKIKRYGKSGVLGVDMETSAMYTLGKYRGVRVCNLLIVSDELWHEWRIAFGSPDLKRAERDAKKVVLRVLKDLR